MRPADDRVSLTGGDNQRTASGAISPAEEESPEESPPGIRSPRAQAPPHCTSHCRLLPRSLMHLLFLPLQRMTFFVPPHLPDPRPISPIPARSPPDLLPISPISPISPIPARSQTVSAVQLKEVEVILQQHEGTLQPPAHNNAPTAAAAPAATCAAACAATDLLGRAAPPPPSRPSFVIG